MSVSSVSFPHTFTIFINQAQVRFTGIRELALMCIVPPAQQVKAFISMTYFSMVKPFEQSFKITQLNFMIYNLSCLEITFVMEVMKRDQSGESRVVTLVQKVYFSVKSPVIKYLQIEPAGMPNTTYLDCTCELRTQSASGIPCTFSHAAAIPSTVLSIVKMEETLRTREANNQALLALRNGNIRPIFMQGGRLLIQNIVDGKVLFEGTYSLKEVDQAPRMIPTQIGQPVPKTIERPVRRESEEPELSPILRLDEPASRQLTDQQARERDQEKEIQTTSKYNNVPIDLSEDIDLSADETMSLEEENSDTIEEPIN